jgi:hypothetical protein
MAAPTTNIPLASLPRLADTATLLSLPFGSAFLLLLLGLDAWRSKSKKTHWIPGDSLVLGALSLQLLGLVSRPFVNISDSEKLNTESVEKISELILSNMFVTLSGRAVMCVFMGNMVADVARSRDRKVWSDMSALAISATGVLIHLSYEIYIVFIHWLKDPFLWNSSIVLYLVINIIILVSIVLVVLLLGCAVFASKSIQEVVAQRIPVLLSRSEHRNPGSVVWWDTVEEHAVRSWITARTHQPQYIIARSILISSIGFLVTICVVFCLGFSIWGWIKARGIVNSEDDGFDWLRVIVVVLQWIFILPGWAIVCWRWLTAVVFYPRRLTLKQFFRLEDFWTRAMLELQEEFMEKDLESIKSLSFFE